MKSFQIRDLIITVDDRKQITPPTPEWQYCYRWGCTLLISCQLGCSIIPSPIPCHIFGPPTILPCDPVSTITRMPDIFKDPTWQEAVIPNLSKIELEELRGGIAELQAKVEAQIKNPPDDMGMLEGRLKEALDEISKQRTNPNG